MSKFGIEKWKHYIIQNMIIQKYDKIDEPITGKKEGKSTETFVSP